jgi:DNA-binding Lrp family transcriptional regulator
MSDYYRDRLRLSEQEKIVLSHVEFQARTPIPDIARDCGYKTSTVRYILNKFIDSGLITERRSFLNLSLLGFTNYALYITISSWGERERESLHRFLSRAPGVTWFAPVGGDFQYIVTFSASHAEELVEFRHYLSQRFSHVIYGQTVSLRLALWLFPRKYLAKDPRRQAGWFQGGSHRVALDDIDTRLLTAVSRGGFDSFRLLAERAELPPSTFDRRVRALEERGVIQGYCYRMNPTKIGFEEFRLLVHPLSVTRDFTSRLLAFSRSHPNVRKFVQCLAEWDYEMEVSVPSAREVSAFIATLNERFRGELRRVRVVPLFAEVNCPPFPGGQSR